MAIRSSARNRAKNNGSQLEFFSLTPYGYETPHPIRTNGGETLAGIPPTNGGGTGNEKPPPTNAPGSGGTNGQGTRSDSPPVDSGGTHAATGTRPGLGDGAGEIHLPPARELIVTPEPEPQRNKD